MTMAQVKFVKPAGKQHSGPTSTISRTIQQVPGGGVFVVGILGADTNGKLTVGPNDPSIASIETIGQDSASKIRWFQLTSKRTGNAMVEARGADSSVLDYFQLVIKNLPSVRLPSASSAMEFEFEPDDPTKPGQINMRVYTPLNEPDYVENRLTAVGYGIYLFGCHLYCTELSMPVFLPDSDIDFTVAKAVSIDSTIYADRVSADAALQAAPPAPSGVTQYAFYRGAGGALIVPTIFSPATTPRTIQTLLTARALLADEVQKELTILALTMVGGLVLKTILTRLVRVGSKTAEPPVGEPPPLRINPVLNRLQNTAKNLLNQNVTRSAEVLTEPKVFRHTLTGDIPPVNYARIEHEGALRLSTGAKAHYGEGVYAWLPGQGQVGTYIDIQVPAGTGVETLKVNRQTFVHMVPPDGNTLSVKIAGTNMPQSQIDMGRKLFRP